MRFSEDQSTARFVITDYGDGYVKLNGIRYTSSLIILPDSPIIDWDARLPGDIQPERLVALLAQGLEVVLIGTGPRLVFPPRETLLWLQAQGIGYEMMNTGALCRTFNLLAAEGRRVAAALLPP